MQSFESVKDDSQPLHDGDSSEFDKKFMSQSLAKFSQRWHLCICDKAANIVVSNISIWCTVELYLISYPWPIDMIPR